VPPTARTPSPTPVLRDDDPQRVRLETDGWTVVARSWGAVLTSDDVDVSRLRDAVTAVGPDLAVRPLTADDVEDALALDAATLDDHPGGPATAHLPLTPSTARPTDVRRGYGAFDGGEVVAMTFLDRDGQTAETDFTVVAPAWRERAVATAVKAASVLGLLGDGVRRFRTGGATENEAILRANARLGYVVDEQWLTYAPPEAAPCAP